MPLSHLSQRDMDSFKVQPSWLMLQLLLPHGKMIVVLVLAAVTWGVWFNTEQAVHTRIKEQFAQQVDDTVLAIEKRLSVQELALLGGVGLFNASDNVSRTEWKQYVSTLNIEKNYPGMQGFGYAEVIHPRDLERHTRRIRAEGFPTYEVKPAGQRDIYTSIIFLEPFDWRNQRAFGYDMFSQETRRAAMERARDRGLTSMSGKVTLVQETKNDVQNGFLIYVPVYRKNAPLDGLDQRRAAIQGFVYSPFRINDLLNGTQSTRDDKINFEIYDGDEINESSQLYDSDKKIKLTDQPAGTNLHILKKLKFAGHTWTLAFSAKPNYLSADELNRTWVVLGVGVVIDILVLLLIFSIIHQHKQAVKESEKLANLASSSTAHIYAIATTMMDGIITINDEGTIEYVNPAVTALFGYPEIELIGKNIRMLMPEPYQSEHDGYLLNYKMTGISKAMGTTREVIGMHKSKKTFPMGLAVTSLVRNGRQVYVGIVRDITEQHATAEQLRNSIEELEIRAREMMLLSSLGDVLQTCQTLEEAFQVTRTVLPQMFGNCSGVMYVSTGKGRQMEIATQWGETTYTMLMDQHDCLAIRRGVPYEATAGKMALYCSHFEPRQPFHSYCVPLLAQGSIIGMLSIFQLEEKQEQSPVLHKSPQQELVVAASKQIAMAIANLTLRQSLQEQSIHDTLTGLHNRRFLQEMLPREVQRAMRKEHPCLSLLLIDVDHFKKINDTYGHAAGDRVLIEVGRVLTTNSRREDIVCRYGGEEFVMVMPNMEAAIAIERANSIRNEIKKIRIEHDGTRIPAVTISIGISILPNDGIADDQLIHAADIALYAAKGAGRDQVCVAGSQNQAASSG